MAYICKDCFDFCPKIMLRKTGTRPHNPRNLTKKVVICSYLNQKIKVDNRHD